MNVATNAPDCMQTPTPITIDRNQPTHSQANHNVVGQPPVQSDMVQLVQTVVQQNTLILQNSARQSEDHRLLLEHTLRLAQSQHDTQSESRNQYASRNHYESGTNFESRNRVRISAQKEISRMGVFFSAGYTQDGKPIDIYLDSLEKIKNRCELSDEELMDLIPGTLKKQPSWWFHRTFLQNPHPTLEGFREALYERFEGGCDDSQALVKSSNMRYSGSGDVLTHIDQITALLKRIDIPQKTQVGIIKGSLPKDMQRFISGFKPVTVRATISLIKDTYPEHCPTSSDTERRQSNQNYQKRAFQTFQSLSAIQSDKSECEVNSTALTPYAESVSHDNDDVDDDNQEFEELCEFITRAQHQLNKFRERRSNNPNRSGYNRPDKINNNVINKCFHCLQQGHIAPNCPLSCGELTPCQGNSKYCPVALRKN